MYPNGEKFIKTIGEAKQVLEITGGVPFEPVRFLSIKNIKSLNEMIKDYSEDFLNPCNYERYLIRSIERWYERLNDQDKGIAIENITSCILNRELRIDRPFMYDKRFFTLEKRDGGYYLKPFFTLAMTSILGFYDYLFTQE